MCTASLVDAYSAMANAAEEHWGLAAAHPLYAALLEKVLAEVARQHIVKLEILAQVRWDKDALSPFLHLVMTPAHGMLSCLLIHTCNTLQLAWCMHICSEQGCMLLHGQLTLQMD